VEILPVPKFTFRLQKVLEYREMEEERAKDAFLAAQEATAEQRRQIGRIVARRSAVIAVPADSIDQRLHLERYLERMDDEERAERAALAVLENEESAAQAEWNARRQAVKALERLREKAFEDWKQEEERREQSALDEWATLRRVPA
jgi:flagellar export protein FliJ